MKPDPDGMNDDRAEWAQQAVDAFQLATNTEPDNLLADLLCDLMHWADRNAETAGSFEDALARAQSHYEAETYDDEAEDDEAEAAEVDQVLTLSTAHVPGPEFMQTMQRLHPVYDKGNVGWLVPVAVIPAPPELAPLWEYAKAHDCKWVMLDQDADTTPSLPAWNW